MCYEYLALTSGQGYYTKDRPHNKLDVVVVEATDIKEDGSIVPGASVGATPELIQMADKVSNLDFFAEGAAGPDISLCRSLSRSTPHCLHSKVSTTSP